MGPGEGSPWKAGGWTGVINYAVGVANNKLAHRCNSDRYLLVGNVSMPRRRSRGDPLPFGTGARSE